MRYQIKDSPDTIFDDYDEAIDYCIDEDYHKEDEYFEEWVNDGYSAYEILTGNYSYDDLLYSYCDGENDNDRENARYELRRANVGDEIDLHYCTIVVIDEEYDEEEDEAEYIETVEDLRRRLDSENEDKIKQEELDKKQEDSLMKMFQVIGG